MKKRVLHVSCDGLGNGGVQFVIMSIVRNLKMDFVFDIVVSLKDTGYYTEEFLKQGRVFCIPLNNRTAKWKRRVSEYLWPFKLYFGLKKIIKNNRSYDAIHCHNYFEAGVCLLVAKQKGIPVRIVHSHNIKSPNEHLNFFRTIYRKVFKFLIRKYATHKIGCSKDACGYLFENDNARVVNNAIDLKKFDPRIYKTPVEQSGVNGIRFIHVGRYCYQKNQTFLINVFKYINERIKDTSLTLIGFGPDEAKIRRMIEDYELKDSVSILPHDTNIPAVFADSDIMIFPSNYEGLGIALIEAQAMGVSCFVSNAVPSEANLGLCRYLDLREGYEYWGREIIKTIQNEKKEKKFVNMDSYNIDNMKELYRGFYLNKL